MLRGADDRDTVGLLVLDTGAGYLALSPQIILRLGLSDSTVADLTFSPRSLKRLEAGPLMVEPVAPILCIDTKVIAEAIDRPALGLLGQSPLDDFALTIDYEKSTMTTIHMQRDAVVAVLPRGGSGMEMAARMSVTALAQTRSREALGGLISDGAVAAPFELAGDGKILVRARLAQPARTPSPSAPVPSEPVASPELSLILDTGATKSVIFASSLADQAATMKAWKRLKGLSAPTLYGAEEALMTRVPRLEVIGSGGIAPADSVDVAVLEGELRPALEQATHHRVDGLLGYSFLRRFRVTIDYPHRIVWFDPVNVPQDQRPYEYSHVGIQIERRDGSLRVVAVAEGSPAASGGIRAGDILVSIDATQAATLDVVGASRKLEGPPGSTVTLVLSRAGREQRYSLKRQRLL